MKVRELKQVLAKYDDDLDVVLSSDGEGNKISPLADHGPSHYRAYSKWSGDLCNDDAIDAVSVCVLWPAN